MFENLIYNYDGMPKNVKKFLEDLIGKEETKRLLRFMRARHVIMLVGPECSGKSTVAFILRRLGYPYVIDENGGGLVIHTSRNLAASRTKRLKTYREIAEELGI